MTPRSATPPEADPRPAALIFRRRLLPWSETFIAAQGKALTRYRPVFTGFDLEEAGGTYLEGEDRVVLAEHDRLAPLGKVLVKKLRRVPGRWRRALARRNPSLVHAHFGHNAPDARPLADAFRIPLVVTFHGADITVTEASARARARRVFGMVDRVIGVSEFIAGQLREAGCPAEKVTVHRIGVDTERFRPDPDVERDEATVLFVGRLVEKKGLAYLLRALPRVMERVPDAEVLVVGDGPLREELEARASLQELPVRFLGVRPPEEVADLMRTATVLAAPSIVAESGDAEGLGMVNVEAQACGMPVVLFPTGGAREAVADGETGFHATPEDPEALARHLVTLLADRGLRERFGRAARARVLEEFDLARQAERLEVIYDEVREGFGDGMTG